MRAISGVWDGQLSPAQQTAHRILKWCAQAKDRPGQPPEAPEGASVDLDYLLELAKQHRLTPLLYRNRRVLGELLTVEGEAELTRIFSLTRARNHLLTDQLMKLIPRFHNAAVPVMPIKGPLLAEYLFGDIAYRHYTDLDLLVPLQSLSQASQVLRESGFEPELNVSGTTGRGLIEHNFVRPTQPPLRVELHWRVSSHFMASVDEMARFWERSRPRLLLGHTVAWPAAEDHLLLLAIHGIRHCWARLGWLADLARFLRLQQKAQELDWEILLKRAEDLGVSRIVWLALELCEELLDVPLPKEISESVRLNSPHHLADQIAERYQRPGISAGGLPLFRLLTAVPDRRRDRLQLAWRLLTQPTLNDFSFAGSASWGRLLPLIRPFRLLLVGLGGRRQWAWRRIGR